MQANIFNKAKNATGYMLGTLALAIALLAQPVSAALMSTHLASPSQISHTPTSHNNLVASALPSTGAPTSSQYFAPTGKTVNGDFLSTYQKYGLSRIGYPISDERTENGTKVQYFERVRMEYHPELANAGYNVLMSRLGAQISQGSQFASVAPFASSPVRTFIPETGHSLAEPFLSYWKSNGNVTLFGYPISEPLQQDGMTVQWFERARMEYHPELSSQGLTVELTLLGKIAYDKSAGSQPSAPQTLQAPQAPQSQAGVASPQAPQGQSSVKLNDMESYVLDAISQQRTAAGLQSVKLTSGLTDLARYRSNDMASRNYFSHVTPEGKNFLGMLTDRGVSYKFAGEILARNNYPTDQAAQTAMQSYLNSPPHKEIIMDGRYSQVGVGYALGAEGMHYFTVIFVQP